MAEYIKRETVINHLDACMDTIWKTEIVALKCFVEGIPAADVVPAVRCGDCKNSTLPSVQTQIYGKPGTRTCHNKKSPCNRRNVFSDDFCRYGERKNDADEPNRA